MPFADLDGFTDPGLDLPIRGTTYRVPPPNARDGLWLQALIDGAESLVLTREVTKANQTVLSEDKEHSAYQVALGAAWERMVDDGVPWPVLKHAGMTAWLYWTRGADTAERHWARFGDGQGNPTTQTEAEGSPPAGSPTDPSTPPAA